MSVETAPPVGVEDRIATELSVAPRQVRAAVDLLDGGSTVPFVARYRKEATGGLDDVQLRALAERLEYLRELEERRGAVLESIETQGKLTDELRAQVLGAETKSRLEDVYLPYKPRRRTKAQIAREAGLEPLAERLLADPTLEPAALAAEFVTQELDADAALDGARAVLVERFSEDADLIGDLRERMWKAGAVSSSVRDGKDEAGKKFADYFALTEAFTAVKSHRVLAMLRGEREDVLSLAFAPDRESPAPGGTSPQERAVAARFGVSDQGRPADRWLLECVRLAWRARILTHLALDTRSRLRTKAEEDAVGVFAANLRDLLLAAPAGARTTLGLDPGLRTGVKVAVVDGTGKVVATDTIYPHEPRKKWDESLASLRALVETHGVDLVAIGNGTASRETDKLARELAASLPDRKLTTVVVSEAGASVYSASEYASRELPDLDVSLRGAASIARRLQDPLAELVKIDPRSIGVGQYQHDLPQGMLTKSLEAVVEDCVNAVGVDVNTASGALLRQVSGIGDALAANIVTHRDEHGPFGSRDDLRKVPLLGAKAFEQSAGFLRISGGANPLDGSGVHPEAYPVAERIAAAVGGGVDALIGSPALKALDPTAFVDEQFGLPTVRDILAELDKPGRDPRPSFRAASFAEGVEKISDLKPGMVLEGVVTNVAAFGAFVDVGVHQDGLVHVSALSNTFVADPREVARPGDVVKVKVLEVDEARKRISLTMKLQEGGSTRSGRPGGRRPDRGEQAKGERPAGGRGRGRRSGAKPGAAPVAATGAQPVEVSTGPSTAKQADGGGTKGRGPRPGGPRPERGGPRPDRSGPRPDRGGPRPDRAGRPDRKPRDGQPGDQRGNPRKGGESGGRRSAPPDTAMADALRRAGLLP